MISSSVWQQSSLSKVNPEWKAFNLGKLCQSLTMSRSGPLEGTFLNPAIFMIRLRLLSLAFIYRSPCAEYDRLLKN